MLAILADWIRRQPLLHRAAHAAVRMIPDAHVTLRVRDLGPLRVRLRRHRWFLWSDFAESDSLALGMFHRVIHPEDVVYDIGANIGLYTRVMATWLGAGRIIAFEPMRDNFELLQANIALGRLNDRVRAFPIALGDVNAEEDLQIDDMTSGTAVLSSISGGRASHGRREFGLPPLTERVRIVKLDEFISQEELPPPDVIKVDVEGAELKVLQGARETLAGCKPRLVIALHYADITRDVLHLLADTGYFVFGFVLVPESKTGKASYRQIHAIDADRLANNNIIASADVADVCEEITPWSR
jgi:FkbM family methyltransferase